MHPEAIDNISRKNILLLQQEKILEGFYLAEGTAVALHLGHRISYDLDLFTLNNFDGMVLANQLKAFGKVESPKGFKDTFLCRFNDGNLSFFKLKDTLIRQTDLWEKVEIASLEDLVAMKIDAISSRGKKRDFIDLFSMMEKMELTIHEALNFYREKYEQYELNEIHVAKSLRYFKDADLDPMPNMLKPVEWEKVKKFFLDQKMTLEKMWDKDGPDFGMSM